MRKISEAKKMTLEDPKADKPKASAKLPTKYELSWSQFDDKHNIVDKTKKFSTLEKFREFKSELELHPDFLQIHHEITPQHMEQLPASKSDKMEKVKIKENKLRNLIRLAILQEITRQSNKQFYDI